MGHKRNDPTAHYQIAVEGELDATWADSFNGMTIELEFVDGLPISTLTGPVPDQAALRGIVCRLWDLNLTLIRVRRLPAPAINQGGSQDV